MCHPFSALSVLRVGGLFGNWPLKSANDSINLDTIYYYHWERAWGGAVVPALVPGPG